MLTGYEFILQPKQLSFTNFPILSEKIHVTFLDDTQWLSFHLPKENTGIKINAFLSGGIDSGSIAWMLLSFGISPTFYSIVDKAFVSKVEMLKEYLAKSFPTQQINHIYVDRDPEVIDRDGHSIRRFASELVYGKYPNEIFYDGTTHFPPKSILSNFGFVLPNRPLKRYYRSGDLTLLDCNYGWYSPYMGFDKRYSVLMAKHFGFDVTKTWSCTESEVVECGKCYACIERQWALNEVDKLPIENIVVI